MTRLDDIKARVEAATPGPWRGFRKQNGDWAINGTAHSGMPWEEFVTVYGFEVEPENAEGEANADFIAHARTDLPALLAVVEAAAESARLWKAHYVEVETGGTGRVIVGVDAPSLEDCLAADDRLRAALAPLLEDVG